MRLGQTEVLDAKGERFAAMGNPSHQRSWVPLSEVPDSVQKAFIAGEDKRFFQHGGGDERGLIRALVGNLAAPGRPQGGSTITQQVAKNLLVGGDVTFERKIREVVVASRIERTYSKPEILEIYLNSIYFGRGAWGGCRNSLLQACAKHCARGDAGRAEATLPGFWGSECDSAPPTRS